VTLAHSKVSARGQISVPAEIRKKLGIGSGSVLEWSEQSGQVFVRKAGRYSSEEVHAGLFGDAKAAAKKPSDVKAGIKHHMRKRHARS
jgi:antitoxin PrlF